MRNCNLGLVFNSIFELKIVVNNVQQFLNIISMSKSTKTFDVNFIFYFLNTNQFELYQFDLSHVGLKTQTKVGLCCLWFVIPMDNASGFEMNKWRGRSFLGVAKVRMDFETVNLAWVSAVQ